MNQIQRTILSNVIYPVLLCDGSGTRLLPHSRRTYPKQFVELIGVESLFQLSANRVCGESFSASTLFTSYDFRFTTKTTKQASEETFILGVNFRAHNGDTVRMHLEHPHFTHGQVPKLELKMFGIVKRDEKA